MKHLVPTCPPHVRFASGEQIAGEINIRPESAYHFGTTIPHWLKISPDGTGILIMPSDRKLTDTDMLVNEFGGEVMVTEVLERRKARGDWSLNPYDKHPDYVKIKFL